MTSFPALLFRIFMDICLLRRRPQDVPLSRELFAVCLTAYFILSTLLTALSYPLDDALLSSLVECGSFVLVTVAVLRLRGVGQRWMQTTTALTGSGSVLTLFAIPVFFWGDHVGHDAYFGAPTLLAIALLTWNVAVVAHILRHALSVPFAVGVLAALAYLWIISVIVAGVLPMGAQA